MSCLLSLSDGRSLHCSREGSGIAKRPPTAASGEADFLAAPYGRRLKIGGTAMSLTPEWLVHDPKSEREEPAAPTRGRDNIRRRRQGEVWRGFPLHGWGSLRGRGFALHLHGVSLRGAACPPFISPAERSIRSVWLLRQGKRWRAASAARHLAIGIGIGSC